MEVKEVQTDLQEPEPPAAVHETVPVTPPPQAPAEQTEDPEEHGSFNGRLASQDRELLKSCIEEIRNLTTILAGRPGLHDVSGASHSTLAQSLQLASMCLLSSDTLAKEGR